MSRIGGQRLCVEYLEELEVEVVQIDDFVDDHDSILFSPDGRLQLVLSSRLRWNRERSPAKGGAASWGGLRPQAACRRNGRDGSPYRRK